MAVKWAECHMKLRADVPVSRDEFGGDLRLIVKGKRAAELFGLLAALREPGADVAALVEKIRAMGADEDSGDGADDGADGGGAA